MSPIRSTSYRWFRRGGSEMRTALELRLYSLFLTVIGLILWLHYELMDAVATADPMLLVFATGGMVSGVVGYFGSFAIEYEAPDRLREVIARG